MKLLSKNQILVGCILCLIFTSHRLSADPVNSNTAKIAAKSFFESKSMLRSSNDEEPAIVRIDIKNDRENYFYVLEAPDKHGWLILAGDDDVIPIIAYSDEGSFNQLSGKNENFEYWMDCMKEEIDYIVEKNKSIPKSSVQSKSKTEWNGLLNRELTLLRAANASQDNDIPRLLGNIIWNQQNSFVSLGEEPTYNKFTPNNWYVGCAAVAIGQIVKAQLGNRSITGTGSHSYTHSTGVLSANFGNTTYNFADMPGAIWGITSTGYIHTDEYGDLHPVKSTDTEINAVAQFLYHVGIACNMDYNPSGSGASATAPLSVLPTYFKYKQPQGVWRNNTTDLEWNNLVLSELQEGRPVYYTGQSGTSGHGFVVDGYRDADQKYHFNWGWGGSQNGFFTLSLTDEGSITYKYDQIMVIGLIPDDSYISVTGVSVDPTTATLNVNNTVQLTATVIPSNANNKSVTWSSSDPTVATVDAYGRVTARERGSAVITVTTFDGEKTATCTITVNQPVTGVSLNQATAVLSVPKTLQLTATIIPSNANNTNVTWSSSDPTVATVSINGLVTAISNGTVIITATTEDGNYKATCSVSIRNPAVIALNPVSGSLLSNDLYLYETSVGNGVILPEAIPCNNDWTFAGWSKTLINIPTDPIDESIVSSELIPIGLFIPSDETLTLYAVYKKFDNRGKKEKQTLFADFNNGLPLGWEAPGTYIPVGGINGSECRTFVKEGDVISTPPITDPCRITFFVCRAYIGGRPVYNGSIGFSVQIRKIESSTWETISTFSSDNNGITFSWTTNAQKECNFNSLNLVGEYRIRFILDSVEEEYYCNLLLDDVTVYSSFIDEGNSFTSIINDCTPTTIAWQGGNNSNWDNFLNWKRGQVPTSIDTVTIPGVTNHFPDLNESTGSTFEAAEIHFEPGAQLGGQSKLTGKAFVQYDFNNDNKRNRWQMLSIPLGEVYPGDFVFGGYPLTWVQTFTSTEGKGSWTTISGSRDFSFSYGDGFVLWLDKDVVSGKGLARLKGIHELPYFQHLLTNNSPDYIEYHERYPSQDYNGKESIFYNFKYENGEYIRIEDGAENKYSVERDLTKAYQLAADFSKEIDFGTDDIYTLIGNPYMATLKFDDFSSANSGTINPVYYVWKNNDNGDGDGNGFYESYSTAEPGNMDQNIAPLQGFIVEKYERSYDSSPSFRYYAPPSVQFKEEWTTVKQPPAVYLSPANSENRLKIIAHNPVSKISAFITKREVGQDEFGRFDARKITNGISTIPEIYTLKPYKNGSVATAINIINNDDLLIPLGLSTSYSGNITLTLTGMDSYNANLSLIDAGTNRTIDLSGLTSYDYTINYTPKISNGAPVACEDRFFIRISKSATGLKEIIAEKVNVFETNGHIQVVSSASNPIKEVAVYNLQGVLMYEVNAINAISHTVDRNWPSGAYIVKVVSEKNTDNVKVILR